jgi:hypothetical protein
MVELSGRIAWVGRKVIDEFEEQYQEANQNENWESAARSVPIKLNDMREQVEKNRSDLEETSIQRAMT